MNKMVARISMLTRPISMALAGYAVVSFAIAIWDIASGGFYLNLLGVRISSWDMHKPLRNGEICALLAFWIHDLGTDDDGTSWKWLDRWSGMIAAVLAILLVFVAIRFGTYAAGGADGYGYVSEAGLLASGQMLAPNRLAGLVPALGAAVAPLGYRLATTPEYLAPIYAPGLPLAMALSRRLGGSEAVFLVVPLLGGLAVWLTYALAARVADRRTGLVAAALLAFSPLFFFHSLVPMSDVPVTAWWLLAWVLALSSGSRTAVGSGLAASAAVLTRPNLVPLALALAMIVAARSGARRAVLFAVGVFPSIAAIALLYQHLYGSPFRSGYGAFDALFAFHYFIPNIRQFWSWSADLHTPAILLGLLAPLTGRVRGGWSIVGFMVAVLACYVFYLPFFNWTFLRFLLPALPLLFILDGSVAIVLLSRLPVASRGAGVFALCTLVPFWFIGKDDGLRFFEIEHGERRFVTVGHAIGAIVPANAAVISLIHSGSVRLYGERQSLRWDLIDPDRLDAAIRSLQEHNYVPYFLLEDWEEPRFRDRFGPSSHLGRIDWPPTAEYLGDATIRLYSIEDRDRHLHGDRVLPRMIPAP